MKSNCSRPDIRRHGALTLFAISAFALACGSTDKSGTQQPNGSGGVDWVTMGYDLQSTYNNTKETKISKDTVASLKFAWKMPPGPQDGGTNVIKMYGTPVVVGDTLYAGAADGIHAFNANTGAQIWAFADGDAISGISSSPSYENGILYFTTSNGSVMAVDVRNNPPEIKWDSPPQAADLGFSSAIIAGDFIITGNSTLDTIADPPYRGGVTARHKADGSLAWHSYTCDTTEDGCAVWGSVSVDPTLKTVFAPVGNNYSKAGPGSDSVFAFDVATGNVKWHKQVFAGDVFNLTNLDLTKKDWDFGANPVVFDYNGKKLVAAGAKSGVLYVWDREAGGDPLQSRDLGGFSQFLGGIFQGLAFDGQRLITVCNGATSTAPGSEPDDPNLKGGTSVLYALEPDTLNIIYERQLRAPVWNPITIANGVGFLGMQTTLEAFDVETGAALFTYVVPGTIGSGITISNGRIFFGSGMTYLAFVNHEDGTIQSLALP